MMDGQKNINSWCILPFVSAVNFSFEKPLWEKNESFKRLVLLITRPSYTVNCEKRRRYLIRISLQKKNVSHSLVSCYVTRITLRLCAHNNKYYVHNLIFGPGFLVVFSDCPLECQDSVFHRVISESKQVLGIHHSWKPFFILWLPATSAETTQCSS